MKKLILLSIILIYSFTVHAAGPAMMALVSGGGSAEIPYCTGTGGELFCSTFESSTSWDSTSGTSKCDGYTSDGDFCDGESSVYVIGTKSLGIRGSSSYYVEKTLSTSGQTEFYIEAWVRWSYVGGSNSFIVMQSSGSKDTVRLSLSSGSVIIVTNDGLTTTSTTCSVSANTWYHVGLYYKSDGTLRYWQNTATSSGFSAIDNCLNSSVTTGSLVGDYIRLRGSSAGGDMEYYDNFKIIAGAPSWEY